MPLTMQQQTRAFTLLEGDQTDDEPRGLEKMLTDLARARSRFRGMLDQLTGFDPETGLFTVRAGTGTHNDMAEASALAALRRARNVMRVVTNELDAFLEGFTPDADPAAAGGESERGDT
jgi:hypothetical protein